MVLLPALFSPNSSVIGASGTRAGFPNALKFSSVIAVRVALFIALLPGYKENPLVAGSSTLSIWFLRVYAHCALERVLVLSQVLKAEAVRTRKGGKCADHTFQLASHPHDAVEDHGDLLLSLFP
jgi:hypothetical protein